VAARTAENAALGERALAHGVGDLEHHSAIAYGPETLYPETRSSGVVGRQAASSASRASTRAFDHLSKCYTLVLVVDPSLTTYVEPSLVQDFLGPTLGKSRIAGAGLSAKDTGNTLGIEQETVRTVLKRIFAKTGLGRQADLVALLAKLGLVLPREPIE
jgi:hypothetical protein